MFADLIRLDPLDPRQPRSILPKMNNLDGLTATLLTPSFPCKMKPYEIIFTRNILVLSNSTILAGAKQRSESGAVLVGTRPVSR